MYLNTSEVNILHILQLHEEFCFLHFLLCNVKVVEVDKLSWVMSSTFWVGTGWGTVLSHEGQRWTCKAQNRIKEKQQPLCSILQSSSSHRVDQNDAGTSCQPKLSGTCWSNPGRGHLPQALDENPCNGSPFLHAQRCCVHELQPARRRAASTWSRCRTSGGSAVIYGAAWSGQTHSTSELYIIPHQRRLTALHAQELVS